MNEWNVIYRLIVDFIYRSAGGTFARRPTASDICHYTTEACQHPVDGVCFSDSTGCTFDPSACWCPKHSADRRTEILTVQHARRSGSAHSGKCRRSESRLGDVVSAAVVANDAKSVNDDTNVIRPTHDPATYTPRGSDDNFAVFYICWFDYEPWSVCCNWQESTVKFIRCYTRSCTAR